MGQTRRNLIIHALSGGSHAGDFLFEFTEMPRHKTYCQRGAKRKQESNEDSHGNVINAKDFSSWRRLREARNIEALLADEHANIVREKRLKQSGDVEAGAQRVAH